MSLHTAVSGNLSTVNQQRSNGNSSASFPSQPLAVSGNMTGGSGGWSSMTGRLGSVPDSVSKLAGTSHLLRAASWELYGRWVLLLPYWMIQPLYAASSNRKKLR